MLNDYKHFYLMENPDEIRRLELKTDPDAVKSQAQWCGVKPGLRILDAGCGPGKTTSILYSMVKPNGKIMGLDYSEERIQYARENYAHDAGIQFHVHDLRAPLNDFGAFDLVWVRFVLEHNRKESHQIVNNLTKCLKPKGVLCLLDLDHNALNHYELPTGMMETLYKVRTFLEVQFNFDAYSGRKLYSYLYDEGYASIELDLRAHHLIYGKIGYEDFFNWLKKAEMASEMPEELFEEYAGGFDAFFSDFKKFLRDPRRFIYTPLILCKGRKPNTFQNINSDVPLTE